jgi:endonuclease/exonuclease/phosphatase family metal-dependent hydrolase
MVFPNDPKLLKRPGGPYYARENKQQKTYMNRLLIFPFLWTLITFSSYSQDLSVLTYNLRYDTAADSLNRWDNRKEFLISQIGFYSPDVFGVQEGLLHQLQAIKRGLPGYDFIGKGRDDGGDEGEFSAIFYNSKSLILLEEHMFWLSETPEVPSKGWDAAIKRVCTYGRFKTLKEGREFYVFNTHFDHIGEEARKESAGLILRTIGNVNKEHLPVVLMGDLNLEPEHEAIGRISAVMDDAHTLPAGAHFGPPGTFNGFVVNKPVTRRIDYLFLSPGDFDLKKYGILTAVKDGRFPSDHFPVYAELFFH